MRSEKLERLIWERIDGTIADEDRERLEAYLTNHSEARDCEQDLTVLAELLEGVEAVASPLGLRTRIEQAITSGSASAKQSAGWLEALRLALTTGRGGRYAHLAAGLFVGVVGYHLLSSELTTGQAADVSGLYGSMSLPGSEGKTMEIDLAGVEGSLALHREQSLIVANLHILDEGEIELLIDFGEGNFRLERLEESGAGSSQISIEKSRIVLKMVGVGRYSLAAAVEEVRSIEIVILGHGKVLLEREVRVLEIPMISGTDRF